MDIGLIGGTCPSNRHAPIGGEGSLRLAAAAEVGAVPRSPIPAPVGRQQIHTFTRAHPHQHLQQPTMTPVTTAPLLLRLLLLLLLLLDPANKPTAAALSPKHLRLDP